MVKIIFSTNDGFPIYPKRSSPWIEGRMCKWCFQIKKCLMWGSIRNFTSVRLTIHSMGYFICINCLQIYTIIRPSADELLLRIHTRYLRQISEMLLEHIPHWVRSIVTRYISEYPMKLTE